MRPDHPPFPPPKPPPQNFAEHVRRTVSLALPVVVSRSGMLVLVAVDTAMTGHASALQLAFLGIGMAPQIVLMVISIGLLMGTSVLTAQADGAGSHAECGTIWRVSLLHALALGLVASVLCVPGEAFLLAIGQRPVLARGGGHVLIMFAWSIAPMLIGLVSTMFLEALGRPKGPMMVMLGANVLNVGLNWLLIYGHWGLPAFGAQGAAAATSIVRILYAGGVVMLVLNMADADRYGLRAPLRAARETSRKLRRLGYPLGAAYGLETGAVMTLVMMAGYLGALELAAYQVANNLVALIYMMALGVATATSVRVGNAIGRRDRAGIASAGWLGVGLIALLMLFFAALLLAFPEELVAIYANDAGVRLLAAPVIRVIGLYLIFDGIQAVSMGALRGTADVWVPACLHLTSFWVVVVPLAAWFAFGLRVGVVGLAYGMLAGVTLDALLLSLRFRAVSRRDIGRY